MEVKVISKVLALGVAFAMEGLDSAHDAIAALLSYEGYQFLPISFPIGEIGFKNFRDHLVIKKWLITKSVLKPSE